MQEIQPFSTDVTFAGHLYQLCVEVTQGLKDFARHAAAVLYNALAKSKEVVDQLSTLARTRRVHPVN